MKRLSILAGALRCMFGRHALGDHIPYFGWVCGRCGYFKRSAQ